LTICFTSQLLIASTFIAAQANDSAPPLADALRRSLKALNQRNLEEDKDNDSVECMEQTMMIYKAFDGEDPHQDFEELSKICLLISHSCQPTSP